MASQTRFGPFRHSDAGVASLLKGAAVRSWVESEAGRVAASASAAAAARRPALDNRLRHGIAAHDPESFSSPAYSARAKAATFDTIGVVSTATLEGIHDENQNHTLDRYL